MSRPPFRSVPPIVRKEFRQIRRDPLSLMLLLALPAALLLFYGFALNFDFKHIPTAVCDQDGTRDSRDFLRLFSTSPYFDVKASLGDPRDADAWLGEEKARLVIVVPRGFSRSLRSEGRAEVQVLADGSNATGASTGIGYITAIAQGYSLRLTSDALLRRGLRMPAVPITSEPRVWYNPELRSAIFLVPGLMAFILMGILVVSTAFAVVREKERGTMEQIVVSPVRPYELVIGKTIPYAAISLVSTHLILLLGAVLFRVPLRGSYPVLLLVVLLFLLGALGQGLLISSITRTQAIAFIASALTTFLPTFILSGFVFPLRNMPFWVQAVSHLVPARYFLAALRAIMLKGAGLHAFWAQLIYLAGFAALMGGLSIARLRRGLMPPAGGTGRKRRRARPRAAAAGLAGGAP